MSPRDRQRDRERKREEDGVKRAVCARATRMTPTRYPSAAAGLGDESISLYQLSLSPSHSGRACSLGTYMCVCVFVRALAPATRGFVAATPRLTFDPTRGGEARRVG